MDGFLEGPLIVPCSLGMSIMCHSYYGRDMYVYVMLKLTLFIIDTLKISDTFYFVCYMTIFR